MLFAHPLYSRRERRRYKDHYDLGSHEDNKRNKWDTFITAFLEDDNGNPPETRVSIQTYARRNDINPHDAEVDERNVWVNLKPEDAICFAKDLFELLSALFDLKNYIPYAFKEEYEYKVKEKKEGNYDDEPDEETIEHHNPIFDYDDDDH